MAYALGDPNLPNPANWRELRAYLTRCGAEQEMLEAANIVWRSYQSHLSKTRRVGTSNAFGRTTGIVSMPLAPAGLHPQA